MREVQSNTLENRGRARARGLAWACVCAAALLAVTCAPTIAAGKPTATTSSNQRTGAKAVPSFPVPASARVHGTPANSSTTTTSSGAPAQTGQPNGAASSTTATPAAPATAGGTAAQGGIPTPGSGSPTRLGLARAHHRSAGKLSTTALIAAALAGLLMLLCAVWAAFRWLAIEPRWTRSLTYSLEEASFRTSATWAELLDWARLGR